MHAEPRWIATACRAYQASLRLYPATLRDAHGGEMLQAFRDRCREAQRRGEGPWGLLVREWLPDLVCGASEAHLAQPAFANPGRQLLVLALLCLSLLALLTQDRFGRSAADAVASVRIAWKESRYLASLASAEGQSRRLALALGAADAADDRALAAYLYGNLAGGRELGLDTIDRQFPYPHGPAFEARLAAGSDPGDAARGARIAASLSSQPLSAPALAALAKACASITDCDRGAIVRRLVAVDPGNGYAWSLAFTEASRRKDEAGMSAAVQAIARAARYDTYDGAILAGIFAASRRVDDRPGFLATTAWAATRGALWNYDHWRDSVTLACSPAHYTGQPKPRWVDLHPQHAADCTRIARLLAGSDDLRASRWGLRQLSYIEPDPAQRQRARAGKHALDWLTIHIGRDPAPGYRWTPWTQTQWAAWAQAWAPGDGQAPAMRRWMQASGTPLQPADWFVTEAGG